MKDGAYPQSRVPDITGAGAVQTSHCGGGVVNAPQSGPGVSGGLSWWTEWCFYEVRNADCCPLPLALPARRWDSRTLGHFARGVCTNPSQLAPAARGPASPLPRPTYASTSGRAHLLVQAPPATHRHWATLGQELIVNQALVLPSFIPLSLNNSFSIGMEAGPPIFGVKVPFTRAVLLSGKGWFSASAGCCEGKRWLPPLPEGTGLKKTAEF